MSKLLLLLLPFIPVIGIPALSLLLWFRAGAVSEFLIDIINFILGILVNVTNILFNLIAQLAVLIINVFILLNPFSNLTVAPILWEFFKNISYVALVFLSLFAGFQFILNREDNARKLLIGILIVAFLINFTFVLAKEFFLFFWFLTKSALDIVGQVASNKGDEECDGVNNACVTDFGNTLYFSMALFIGDKGKQIAEKIKNNLQDIKIDKNQLDFSHVGISLVINLFFILMAFIASCIMAIFAGIAFGKFFIISFLVGLLPLACIAYLLPGQKEWFDKWWKLFFTWNINILILILLISIGIFLFASTAADAGVNKLVDEIFLANTFEGQTGDTLPELPRLLAPLLAYSGRFFVIVIYYAIVLGLALKLGGRFSDFGYNFVKWAWLTTGSLTAGGAKQLASGPLFKLGNRLNEIANELAKRGAVGALLAKRIRGVGETLQRPVKQRSREIAESVWQAVRDQDLNEIIKAAQRLKGESLAEFTKLITRSKTSEDVTKIYNSDQAFWGNNPKAMKILCQKVMCAFDDLKKGNYTTAASKLAKTLDFISISINNLETLLGQIDSTLRNKFIEALIANMPKRQKNNFFSNITNLKKLKDYGLESILTAESDTIEKTPTFRLFREFMGNILNRLGLQNEQQRQILNKLLDEYKRGNISLETTLRDVDQLLRTIENSIEQGDADSAQKLQQSRSDEPTLRDIDSILSQLRNGLISYVGESEAESKEIAEALRKVLEEQTEKSNKEQSETT
ncbi:MAG: hypothetical protein KatS3mg095_0082 [Candidatus Parcubacteria bacterium]|nr:MAG: hypothetical protein KatS3mg095_0082 [Candidatus Parcubacteria bacterium]